MPCPTKLHAHYTAGSCSPLQLAVPSWATPRPAVPAAAASAIPGGNVPKLSGGSMHSAFVPHPGLQCPPGRCSLCLGNPAGPTAPQLACPPRPGPPNPPCRFPHSVALQQRRPGIGTAAGSSPTTPAAAAPPPARHGAHQARPRPRLAAQRGLPRRLLRGTGSGSVREARPGCDHHLATLGCALLQLTLAAVPPPYLAGASMQHVRMDCLRLQGNSAVPSSLGVETEPPAMPTAPPSPDDYQATPASRVESGEALFAIAPSGESLPNQAPSKGLDWTCTQCTRLVPVQCMGVVARPALDCLCSARRPPSAPLACPPTASATQRA